MMDVGQFDFDFGQITVMHHHTAVQTTLLLGAFMLVQVASASFAAHNFASASHFIALGASTVGFHLGHWVFLPGYFLGVFCGLCIVARMGNK